LGWTLNSLAIRPIVFSPLAASMESHFCLEGRVVRLPHTRKHTIPPFKIWQAQNPLIPPVQLLGSSSARGFSVQICFSGSIFAFFGVIDIAERPEVYDPCGQAGRFIGRSRNLSNSSCTGKSKFLFLTYS
jgi:hypothetical protein